MADNEPGAGDVTITLDGEEATLRPTLAACQAISRAGGGLYGPGSLSERITRFDFDAYTAVIRAGLGLTGNAVRDLDERIFRTGLTNLIAPLTSFIVIVGNGGKPPTSDDDGEGGSGKLDNPPK